MKRKKSNRGISGRKSRRRKRVLFLPGLGTDRDMYVPILEHIAEGAIEQTHFEYRDSLRYRDLESYAHEMFAIQGLIGQKFDVIVGTSMGGMIAQIALRRKWIKAARCVLISTAFSGEDLTALSGIVGNVIRILPDVLTGIVIHVFAFSYPYLRATMRYRFLFSRMILRVSPRFMSKGIDMILRWRGVSGETGFTGVRLIAFHGTRDPLIAFEKILTRRTPEHILPRGNHIVFTQIGALIAGAIMDA